MKIIKEIVGTISKKKLRPIETINLSGDQSGAYNSFFHLIAQGEITTDDEAAMETFGVDRTSKKYLMFKSRFRNRLINHLFFLYDTELVSDEAKEKIFAYRNIFLANILIALSANTSAFYFVKKVLPIIKKNEWYDLYIVALRISLTEATLNNKYKKTEKISQDIFDATVAFSLESKAQVLYEQSRSIFRYRKVLRKAEREKLESIITELQLLYDDPLSSFQTKWYAILIQLSYLSYELNYKQVLIKVEEIEAYLKNNLHFYDNGKKYFLSLFKIESYAQLKEWEAGERVILEIEEVFSEGKLNWFTLQKNKFMYAMAQANYLEALDCLNCTMRNKNFDKLSSNFIEQWKIWEAYLYIIFKIQKNIPEDLMQKDFRINKFLNEISVTLKDKMGLNASVIILFFLHAMMIKDYDAIIDKDRANVEYSKRYLRTDNSKRVRMFFKLMNKLVKLEFEPIKSQLAIEQTKKDLEANSDTYGGFGTLEVIPLQETLSMLQSFIH